MMDKDQKEALQVTKELTAKLIEARTVSPGSVGDVFPAIFKNVHDTIRASVKSSRGGQQ